ncbi:universal stress protein [Halobellus limi]|jgi:nucleotide-binding universal stress UspA family protein|uniref:Universal stress protein n=1 Tax=Halobellus limi TaxID=699433 RepID=A0A1H5ZKP6_9EURY|nr:universal stress protein [Halobellus limi]QCC48050.1 universal stress protein [Halobellus limi]SEG37019.1 Nucleotide-binding universal stress protein, UspA family [Halobellus limi]
MVIVAAVDRSDQAQAVLDEADTLARRFDEPIHVLHVMNRSEAIQVEEDSLTHTDEAVPVDDLRDRAAAVAAELMEAHPPDAEAVAVGRIGDPAGEIVSYAGEQDARYIVVSPQQRSQTGKILFGSVAQSVLLQADCPVVSLRARALE